MKPFGEGQWLSPELSAKLGVLADLERQELIAAITKRIQKAYRKGKGKTSPNERYGQAMARGCSTDKVSGAVARAVR